LNSKSFNNDPFNIMIADHKVGKGHPVFVIAEIGQAHDGSLGQAHAYIDAVAKSGAQAVKFQTHIADAESSSEEAFRVNFSYEDKTRFDYWKRMEFTPEQWAGLKLHADQKGLIFLSTPFSFEAVDLLRLLDVPAWKVASGETTNLPMISAMAEDGKPLLLSTGLSDWNDIEAAVDYIRAIGNGFAVFQCTSAYPCPPEELGLNIVQELAARFECPVGLSDHSGDIHSSIAAVALGADIIELHAVFSKHCFGPDTKSSVTIEDLGRVVQGCLSVRSAIQSPVNKDELASKNAHLKIAFGKSLFAARNIERGAVLTRNDVWLKKPATGIPANQLVSLLGRKLKSDVSQHHKFDVGDFD
jgi:N,N'-diacetyllegionaminate synthase